MGVGGGEEGGEEETQPGVEKKSNNPNLKGGEQQKLQKNCKISFFTKTCFLTILN